MSTKAIEVTTKDLLELQQAIEEKAPIQKIRGLLKEARLYHNSEESLRLPVAQLMIRILNQYVIYPES